VKNSGSQCQDKVCVLLPAQEIRRASYC